MRAIILATVAALVGVAPVSAESRLPTEVASLPPADQTLAAPAEDGLETILVTAMRPRSLQSATAAEPMAEIVVTAIRPMDEIVVTAVRPRHLVNDLEVALKQR